jgi:hypothetical protein
MGSAVTLHSSGTLTFSGSISVSGGQRSFVLVFGSTTSFVMDQTDTGDCGTYTTRWTGSR